MWKIQSSLKAACMAAAALATFSCSQDDLTNQSILNGNTTIIATFEDTNGNTRTSVNGKNEVVWNKNDAFNLFYTTGAQEAQTVSKFSSSQADGTSTSASFSGPLANGATTSYAVYPYQESMRLNSKTVTMILPAEFKYSTASNGPMYADASNFNKGIKFKHLAGLLKLTVSQSVTAEAKKFVITADKNIAGTCTADLGSTDPVLSTPSGSNASKTITVTLNNISTSTTFYIPIPAATYKKLSAALLDEGNKELCTPMEWKNIEVARGGMRSASFGFISIDAGAATAEEINHAIAAVLSGSTQPPTTTEIQLTGTVDAISDILSIKIPAIEKSNVNLTLAEVPKTSDQKPLELKDSSTSDTPPADAVNTMTFAIPKVEVPDNAPSLTITMPKTTVELGASGNDGTTYNKVTALTANNTLVIKKGVTVKDLTVKGGNVRVAGIVEAISKDEKLLTTPYLIMETGGVPPSCTTNFTVIEAERYDLMMAAKNGGTYTLKSDVTLPKPLVITSTMTLDLNGHNITPSSKPSNGAANNEDAIILVTRGANLTINDSSEHKDGRIINNTNQSVYTAVKLTDKADTADGANGPNATLTVNAGTLVGQHYGICANDAHLNTKITINGGTIMAADGTGIFHPQDGTLTVTGGTISGYSAGIEIRAGKLEVKGGTITHTATEFKKATNGSGTTITGAAIAVSQHTTNKALNVTISGGELRGGSLYALYEEDLQDENVSNISMEVTGGKLYGQVFSENCKTCISSGTFSDTSTLNFLADNANVNVNLDKDSEITALYIRKDQTVAMNLNVKTLTIKADAIPEKIDVEGKVKNNNHALISGNLTLKNGSIKNNKRGIALTTNNAKLELDGITYTTAHNDHRGIFNDPNIEGSNIIVKNSTMTSLCYVINTNALTNPVGSTTITLENSTFTAKETPLMVNIPATVKVTNCTFNGGWQGVFLRGATTTFTDSHINLVFDNDYATSSIAQGANWGSGNNAPAAALTAGNRSTGAYDYKTKITLKNTTFSNSSTEKGGKNANDCPAIYIDTESASSKPNQGVELSYDAASENSFNAAGKGLVIGNKDNVKINGSTPQ